MEAGVFGLAWRGRMAVRVSRRRGDVGAVPHEVRVSVPGVGAGYAFSRMVRRRSVMKYCRTPRRNMYRVKASHSALLPIHGWQA